MTVDRRVQLFTAEAFGTAVLMMGGPGAAILAAPHIGILGVALAFGLVLLLLVYAIGPISGCHVNPAVTVGLWLHKAIDTADAVLYVIAQFVGAAIGGLVIFGIASGRDGFDAKDGFAANGWGNLSPDGFPFASMAIVEIAFTALLVFVVLATTHGKFPVGFAGISVGFTLGLIHLVTIPVDNTSVNPARSFGAAIFQRGDSLEQLWAFIVFPAIGAVVGWALWKVIGQETEPSVAPEKPVID